MAKGATVCPIKAKDLKCYYRIDANCYKGDLVIIIFHDVQKICPSF